MRRSHLWVIAISGLNIHMVTINVRQRLKTLASSKMGETFYEFWPRTVFGGIKSAIQIEKQRLKRKGLSFFSKKMSCFMVGR